MAKRDEKNEKNEKDGLAVIEVPLGEASEGYTTTHVEVTRLSKVQSVNLQRMRKGLDESGARLKDGRRVVSNTDVIRYLLECAG